MNLSEAWDAKLGAGSFFAFKKPIQEVWSAMTSPTKTSKYEEWDLEC